MTKNVQKKKEKKKKLHSLLKWTLSLAANNVPKSCAPLGSRSWKVQ